MGKIILCIVCLSLLLGGCVIKEEKNNKETEYQDIVYIPEHEAPVYEVDDEIKKVIDSYEYVINGRIDVNYMYKNGYKTYDEIVETAEIEDLFLQKDEGTSDFVKEHWEEIKEILEPQLKEELGFGAELIAYDTPYPRTPAYPSMVVRFTCRGIDMPYPKFTVVFNINEHDLAQSTYNISTKLKQIQQNIASGLFVYAYEEEIDKLEAMLQAEFPHISPLKNSPLLNVKNDKPNFLKISLREGRENTQLIGAKVFEAYKENPDISRQELRDIFETITEIETEEGMPENLYLDISFNGVLNDLGGIPTTADAVKIRVLLHENQLTEFTRDNNFVHIYSTWYSPKDDRNIFYLDLDTSISMSSEYKTKYFTLTSEEEEKEVYLNE